MSRKSKRKGLDGLWVAPEFSLTRKPGPKLIPLPTPGPSSSPELLAYSSEMEKETSLARILELADVALSKKKRA